MRVTKALPLTPERFADLEMLFAQKGCSFARDCWCMGYRVSGKIKTTDGNPPANPKAYRKRRLKQLSGNSPAPGLIGYDDADMPVGWVAVGPRSAFPRVQNSAIMKPVNDPEAWAIVCFVVPTPNRNQGTAKALVLHAIEHARTHGASQLEAFPVDRDTPIQPQFLWHGTPRMFEQVGFKELTRRKPDRPVMAYVFTPDSKTSDSNQRRR